LHRLLAALLAGLAFSGTAAYADDPAPAAPAKRERLSHIREREGVAVALYGTQLVNGGLIAFTGNLFRGNFGAGQSVHLIVSKPIGRITLDNPRNFFDGFTVEAEGQFIKHFGIEEHLEATLSYVIRTREIRLGRRASFNLAVANGLTYAFSPPKIEPKRNPGVNPSQLLYHIGFETELSLAALPGWSAIMRLHHRSEAFGTFGPDTSTNRFGFGVRYRFR
jgi:hypothetical protein